MMVPMLNFDTFGVWQFWKGTSHWKEDVGKSSNRRTPQMAQPFSCWFPFKPTFKTMETHVGVAQNLRAGVTQVLVFVSIQQSQTWVHFFEPQPCQSWLAKCSLQKWLLFFNKSGRSGP